MNLNKKTCQINTINVYMYMSGEQHKYRVNKIKSRKE